MSKNNSPVVPPRGSRVLVVGCGVSGKSVAEVYRKRGAELHILDTKPIEKLRSDGVPQEWFDAASVTFWLNGDMPPEDLRFDEVVVSPGVPWNLALLNRCRSQGSIVSGELEWALLQIPGRVVIVTGSNGKTTTSLLLYHVLRRFGVSASLIGNIGTPVSSLLLGEKSDVAPDGILVVEASSYQLEASTRFKPEVGILLNISGNHLERHGTLHGYIEAKLTPFKRMGEGGNVILSADLEDVVVSALKEKGRTFSCYGSDYRESADQPFKYWVDTASKDALVLNRGEFAMRVSLLGTPLVGEHNRKNCAAVVLALQALGVVFDASRLEDALRTFVMPSYRIQNSGVYHGVTWVNDSKSTTPEASRTAIITSLEWYPTSPLTVLLGGEMKNASWSGVWALLTEEFNRIARVIFFGRDGGRLFDQFSKYPQGEGRPVLFSVPTLHDAISVARRETTSGGVVVFSPGCASFDEFRSFEDRGGFFDREIIGGD